MSKKKWTTKDIRDMKRMRKNRYTYREIGEKYGITYQRAWDIVNKK